jgi:putative oxidoreductase
MNRAILAARILLGAVFLFFGLNIILQFLHAPMPTGDAGVYMGVLFTHHFLNFVAALEIIGGLLLLVGRFVPLALVLLGPVIVNILLFHALLNPAGIVPGLVVALLELFLIYGYRKSFRGLFDAAPEI